MPVQMFMQLKYLFLYSRGTDGSWKIARAIVNLDEQDGERRENGFTRSHRDTEMPRR